MEKKCIGIDVGGTTVKIGIFEASGALLEKWEVPTRKEEGGKYLLKIVFRPPHRGWTDPGKVFLKSRQDDHVKSVLNCVIYLHFIFHLLIPLPLLSKYWN